MSTATRYPTSGLAPKTNPAWNKPEKQNGAAFEWDDRPDPKKIELGDGEVFTGILTNVERVQVGSPAKPALRYTFAELESGVTYFTIGTYQLDSKIRPTDRGHIVEIRYLGLDENVGRGDNRMKRYGVRVSKHAAPGWAHDGTLITDADIPGELMTA